LADFHEVGVMVVPLGALMSLLLGNGINGCLCRLGMLHHLC